MHDLWKMVLILAVFGWLADAHRISTKLNNETDTFDGDQLIFAHVIFRHGDRNPLYPYPNDPWGEETYFPEGFGQLTNIGLEQEYELGQMLRTRYASLLGDGSYSSELVYIQSTDVDRTLMSASTVLAGLFPPANDQIWNEDLLWQPIPIHTVPKEMDHILYGGRPCPGYQRAIREYLESPEYIDLMSKHKQLFDYLEENAGIKIQTLDDVGILYNTLWIEKLKGKSLPYWTDEVFINGGDFEMLAYQDFALQTNTTELARLSVGFLIRDILDRFSSKMESTLLPNRSLWLYSAHDSTIANILNSLGLFELHQPPYASSLHFELYKTRNDFHMQIFYRNTNDENPPPLQIPFCGSKCSVEEFRSIYSDIIPTESFEDECELSFHLRILDGSDINIPNEWFIIMICVALIVPIFAIITWNMCMRKRGHINMESNNMKYF